MQNFGKAVVKARYVILALAIVLLIPAYWGYTHTRINYDMLTYLPDTIETMQGQQILEDEFGTGAIALIEVEGKDNKTVAQLKQKIEDVPHVKDVLWYDSFLDLSIPTDILPSNIKDAFMKGDATLMAVTFDTTTSDDYTMDAINQIRDICDSQCYVGGTTAVLDDTKDLAEQEEPTYVALAVIFAMIVTALTMDTILAPVMFLLSIGMAIVYNMGTNMFMGQISYVTKALAAVLQLGVTMDYSIFLWNSFKENKVRHPDDSKGAMAKAINQTLQSVIGSSVTTIAGFAALCFMSFTFGLDVGLVMMKGVAFGVVSCVTILPSMILIFEKAIMKTQHKPLIPQFKGLPAWIRKHYKGVLIAFCVMWIPAVYGQMHTGVYYNLDSTLPRSLPSIVANQKISDDFDQNATMMILTDVNQTTKQTSDMAAELEKVDGVNNVIGVDAFVGGGIPQELLPDDITDELSSDNWKLMLLSSKYRTGSDEVSTQIDELNTIIKKYDPKAMLIGDAPCTKDLITISDHDFNIVNWVSIIIVAIIIALVFKSISLPFLLVILIEGAIFINMAVPYYTGETLPFIASIVIGTIQLGSTVDYAVLMTSRYERERFSGKSKDEAIRIAHTTSIPSVICSGFTFFAATFGVGLYSNISLISSICILLARGALISTLLVITVLPAIFTLCDPLITRTSIGFLPGSKTRAQKRREDRKAKREEKEAESYTHKA